jgi:hypothetical protein
MERKMKKMFLLLFIALWQLSCLAIELTEAEIMPKKLIFTELPEDYPPEINELFEFYYNTCKELYSRISDITSLIENDAILESLLNELSHDEIRQFMYWEWLAKNHITSYFFEFLDLHSWIVRNDRFDWEALLPYAQNIKSLLYYPEGTEQAVQQDTSILWIVSIRNYLYFRYGFVIKEFMLFTYSFHSTRHIPIIGELINDTQVSIEDKFFTPDRMVRTFQILEFDTGETIETIVQPLVFSRQPKFIIGKKYLVLKANITLPTKVVLNKLCNIPLNAYFLGYTSEVENDIIKIIKPENWVHFEHFFNVDKLNSSEQQFFDTPVDIFWERYNNFHKLILGGK